MLSAIQVLLVLFATALGLTIAFWVSKGFMQAWIHSLRLANKPALGGDQLSFQGDALVAIRSVFGALAAVGAARLLYDAFQVSPSWGAVLALGAAFVGWDVFLMRMGLQLARTFHQWPDSRRGWPIIRHDLVRLAADVVAIAVGALWFFR